MLLHVHREGQNPFDFNLYSQSLDLTMNVKLFK